MTQLQRGQTVAAGYMRGRVATFIRFPVVVVVLPIRDNLTQWLLTVKLKHPFLFFAICTQKLVNRKKKKRNSYWMKFCVVVDTHTRGNTILLSWRPTNGNVARVKLTTRLTRSYSCGFLGREGGGGLYSLTILQHRRFLLRKISPRPPQVELLIFWSRVFLVFWIFFVFFISHCREQDDAFFFLGHKTKLTDNSSSSF